MTTLVAKNSLGDSAYRYAGLRRRFVAWWLDVAAGSILALAPAFLLGLAFMFAFAPFGIDAGEPGATTANDTLSFMTGFMLGYAAVYLAYQTISTAKGGGVGKRFMGMRVIRESDSSYPTYAVAFGRNIFPMALWVSVNLAWWLDNAFCLWDAKRQTLHDKISGTLVVDVGERS